MLFFFKQIYRDPILCGEKVLNVHPDHRSHGLGSAVLAYLQCNFARVVESAVPFFERNGYTSIGVMKQGNRLNTQIMIKQSLMNLAGRVSRIFAYGDEENWQSSRPAST